MRDQVTLFQGNNLHIMRLLPHGMFDLIFTSPPYNLGNTTGGGVKRLGHYRKTDGMQKRGGKGKRRWDHPAIAAGYESFDDNLPHEVYVKLQHDTIRAMWNLLTPFGAIFYNHKNRILDGVLIPAMGYVPPELLGQVRQEIIWKRSGGINHTGAFYTPMHERIIVIARDGWRLRDRAASAVGDVWEVHQERDNPHPAPFPLGLPLRAMETARHLGPVLDPYCGSGTTIKAAKMMGRVAVGIDLSATYLGWAVDRLNQTTILERPASAVQGSLLGE